METVAAAKGVCLHHTAKETSDVKRLASFYEEIFGFEIWEFEVIWLKLPNAPIALHLIERNPHSKLPEGPWSSTAPIAENIHMICDLDVLNHSSEVKSDVQQVIV